MANQKLQREQPHRFGSTMGHYGVGYGPYVHLPFYTVVSPSVNDGGDMVDTLYPVLSWLTWPLSVGKWTVEGIETARNCSTLMFCCASLLIRTLWCAKAYFQNHDFIANGGKLKPEENPNAKSDRKRTKRYRFGVNKKGEQCSPFLIPARLERVVEVLPYSHALPTEENSYGPSLKSTF